jgi:hypothetical protein
VREEALAHADRLPADLAVVLFRDLLAREKDSAVVLAALDGIGAPTSTCRPTRARPCSSPWPTRPTSPCACACRACSRRARPNERRRPRP